MLRDDNSVASDFIDIDSNPDACSNRATHARDILSDHYPVTLLLFFLCAHTIRDVRGLLTRTVKSATKA